MNCCRASEMGASACCSWSKVTNCCVDAEWVELGEAEEEDAAAALNPCHGFAEALCAALRMGAAWVGD